MTLSLATIKQFNQNVLTLATGTSIAQAIPLLVAPILTRIYSPDEFGLMATFMAMASFLAVMSTGRYEYAIVLPETESDANAVLLLTFASMIGFFVLLEVVALTSGDVIAELLGHGPIEAWLVYVPVSVLMIGAFNTLNLWCNRQKSYKKMGIARVTQTGTSSLSQILFGLRESTAGGLIFGAMLGQLVSTVVLASAYVRQAWTMSRWWHWVSIRKVAHFYRGHPSQLLPADVIGAASLQMPIFILLSAHGPASVGLYVLANRIVLMPVSLVAEAIGQVYRQQASEQFREGNGFRSLFMHTLVRAVGIAIVPTIVLLIFAPDLIRFVFGADWAAAGPITQIVVVAAFFQFVTTCLDNGALIVGATRYLLFWHLVRFSGLLLFALYSRNDELSLHGTVWGIALINIVMLTTNALFQYRFSNYRERI